MAGIRAAPGSTTDGDGCASGGNPRERVAANPTARCGATRTIAHKRSNAGWQSANKRRPWLLQVGVRRPPPCARRRPPAVF